jgi:predicted TIM-barrel fold metal-dependent hydrolase
MLSASESTNKLDGSGNGGTERLLLISNDAHVGPPIDSYREYCPKEYLDDFDAYVRAYTETVQPTGEKIGSDASVAERKIKTLQGDGAQTTRFTEGSLAYIQKMLEQPEVHYDPHVAIENMDREGVAVEVVFHGAQNGFPVPFLSAFAFSSQPWSEGQRSAELAAVGMHMYNRWLADYCSVEPGRHIGCAQVPIWDVDQSVKELEFAASLGLQAINFPAPRRSIRDYNELCWEPFWEVAEANSMSLNTHCSGAMVSDVASYAGVDGLTIMMHEFMTFSRRALPFMILGGVFERHPDLRLIFTEQPSEWVENLLHDLDGIWGGNRWEKTLPRRPSEYFYENCYVGLSFMSNYEARTAVAQGTDRNVLWGRDYPHIEGTWPMTDLSLRMTLEDIPIDAARSMLGLNAVKAYNLDLARVQAIADRIGPTVEELTTPLPADIKLPDDAEWTMAFRKGASWV